MPDTQLSLPDTEAAIEPAASSSPEQSSGSQTTTETTQTSLFNQDSGQSQAQQPTQAAQSPFWREMPGFSDASDETDVRRRIAELQRQAAINHQRAEEYAHRLAASARAAQQQAPEAAKPETREPAWKKHWNPPAIDRDALARWVEIDPETGRRKFRDDTPPQIEQSYNEWLAYNEKFQREFETNPYEVLYKGLKDEFLADARAEWEAQQKRAQYQQYQTRMVDEVMDWAQAVDANGQPIIVQDSEGRPIAALSPDGQKYQSYLNAALSQYPKSEWEARMPYAHDYAMLRMQNDYLWRHHNAQAQQQNPQAIQDANAAAKARFSAQPRRDQHAPNRAGRIAAAADPNVPAKNMTLAEIIKADMAARGETLEAVA